ncbi:MAG: MOSC domain-containing protein [Chloroflexi bacterium]|nr:MOSC domain-containing protein [Chloroflexota bacterium]
MSQHLTVEELDTKLPWICQSPRDTGRLEMIVARPAEGERVVQEVAELSLEGLVGDNWLVRGSRRTADGTAHPEMQITLMNARAIEAIAQERERWPLAGDQLFVDLDLSMDNLPPGRQIAIGTAVLEITAMLHSGCNKFSGRFGQEALRWVNSREGRALRLRGVYARVVQPGVIRPGDLVVMKRS